MFGRKSKTPTTGRGQESESLVVGPETFSDEVLGPAIDAYRASPGVVDFQFVVAARLLQNRKVKSGRGNSGRPQSA